MTNRLHILERERERLEAILADDPHWQALCEIQRRAPTAGRPQVLSADIVAGLNRNETFTTYRRVVTAIAQVRKAEAAAQPEPTATSGGEPPTEPQNLDEKGSPEPTNANDPAMAPAPPVRVDDLTAIRRIDRKTATALNNLGIFSYRTISQWDRHEVRAVRDALDLGKRIWRENWIEQAAVLQMRETAAPREITADPEPTAAQPPAMDKETVSVDGPPHREPSEPTVTPCPVVPEAHPAVTEVQVQSQPAELVGPQVGVAATAPSAELSSTAEPEVDETQPEQAIDTTSLDDVSATGAPEEPSAAPEPDLQDAGPNPQIPEQADSATPSTVALGGPSVSPESAAQETRRVAPMLDQSATISSVAPVATTIGTAAPEPEPSEPTPPVRSELTPRETFKVGQRLRRLPAPAMRRFSYIRGISDTMAEALRAAGVTSLSDIAAWSRADVKWFRAILGDNARVCRDQWIEQAALLSKGTWTRHALRVVSGETRLVVDAPAPLEVRQPAYLLDEPVPESATTEPDLPIAAAKIVAEGSTHESVVSAAGEAENTQSSSSPDETPKEVDKPSPETKETATEVAESHCRPRIVKTLFAEQLPRPTPVDDVSQAPTPSNENDAPESYPQPSREIARISVAKAEIRQPRLPSEPIKPMRGLTTTIALGKLKRPPPDLGTLPRYLARPQTTTPPPLPKEQPEPSETVAARPTPPRAAPPASPQPPPVIAEKPSQHIATDASPDVNLADDCSDAEALLIKHTEPSVAPPRKPGQTPATQPPPPASPPAVLMPPESGAPPPLPVYDEPSSDMPWREEAEVKIVSRPAAEPAVPAAPKAPASPVDMARERISAATNFISGRIKRRRTVNDDDIDEAGTHLSFRDTIEEATVTIIRAEASQEDASAVMPNDVANDAQALDEPEKKKSARAIGSRFLKALTGD